jgi:hypothetical protein
MRCKSVDLREHENGEFTPVDIEESFDEKDLVELQNDSLQEANRKLTRSNDTIENSTDKMATPSPQFDHYQNFKTWKDAINVEDMMKLKGARINRYDGNSSMDGQVSLFSYLAKSGNIEVEQWLLDFFDEYIDALIEWNSSCDTCDGVGGVPHMFIERFNNRLFRAVDNMPPSMEKIELIMRLYDQEPDPYWRGGDNDIYNGNFLVRELICNSVQKGVCDAKWDVYKASKEHVEFYRDRIETIYNQIKMGEVKLIDRESWKSM